MKLLKCAGLTKSAHEKDTFTSFFFLESLEVLVTSMFRVYFLCYFFVCVNCTSVPVWFP